MNVSLEFVLKEQKELSTYGGIGALLGWDQMTYMPKQGAQERAEQTALISKLAHEKVIADPFYNAVTKLAKKSVVSTLEEPYQHVVTRLKKDLEKARKVPSSYVEKSARITTMAYQAWEQAREHNQYAHFGPHLSKILELEQEYISFFDIPGPPYNTLLDDYEEGMTVEVLQKEFITLKKELKALVEQITSSRTYEQQKPLQFTMDKLQQQHFCQILIETMGLPKNRTRLDVSTHPFTTSMGNDDVRITTNFDRPNPLFSVFSTIHEAGHALYELGLPKDVYKDTVIGDSPSLGIHESQSRFWENMIARRHTFWQYFYPLMQQHTNHSLQAKSLETWYQGINQVQPSLIRVEADELTYCLHVILRFELEQQMINQEITVNELPEKWNEYMDEYLGVTPKDDVTGVLQDMHWSGGSIGYFPTYAIGSIYASQLYHQLTKKRDDVETLIQQGQFQPIVDWLHTHIHQYGRLYTADALIKKTCGEGLNAQHFLHYLKEKYLPLYEA